jgi:hypothetical protein
MSSVATVSSGPPDPNTFAKPHRWATYVPARRQKFKTHSSLGLAKGAITGSFSGQSPQYRIHPGDGKPSYDSPLAEAWVYEFVIEEDDNEGRWVERYYVPRGTWKDEHVLWQLVAREVAKPVAQKMIDRTLASIQDAMRATPDADARDADA